MKNDSNSREEEPKATEPLATPKFQADAEVVEPCYIQALKEIILSGNASISMVQRVCNIGYNKSGKIIEWMEEKGYISPFQGTKSRKIYITLDEFERIYGEKKAEPEDVQILKFVVENGRVSVSLLQRRLGLTFERAAKAVAWMQDCGYISEFDGVNPRRVLMTEEEFKRKFEE